MISSSCQSTLKKAKVQSHSYGCSSRSFSCIDCSVTFDTRSYQQHNSCVSEAEKYQGKLYKGKKHVPNQPTTPAKPAPAPTPAPTPANDAKVNNKRKRDDSDSDSDSDDETPAAKPVDVDALVDAAVLASLQSSTEGLVFKKLNKAVRKSLKKSGQKLSKPDVETQVWRSVKSQKSNLVLQLKA